MTRNSYALGKVDYNNSGRRNCRAAITWSLIDGRFSMSAEIWNPRETDCYTCGQCVDTVAAYFPKDAKAQRMLAVWKRWHLNDMRAGTPEQLAIAGELPYEKACEALKSAGMFEHNGYRYGSKWLREELPADVVAEIESWSVRA